jgi:hypothetical protein
LRVQARHCILLQIAQVDILVIQIPSTGNVSAYFSTAG